MKYNSKYKFLTTIEARMTSERFPGKVMMNLSKSKKKLNCKVLEILINRIQKSKYVQDVIIATTKNSSDNVIVNLAKKLNIGYFRGSEKNVLKRLYNAIKNYKHNNIIQLTGDNPLIDYKVIDYLAKFYLSNYPKYDFVSNNNLFQKKKEKFPDGMIVSIFKKKSFNKVFLRAKSPIYKEHPSLFFYTKGKKIFKIKNVGVPKKWKNDLNLRLTLDTKKDYIFLKKIFENLNHKEYFGFTEIINFLKKNKKYLLINSKVNQKIPRNII
jgi:spore coat polysaccharide biosynthesis protein SpsF